MHNKRSKWKLLRNSSNHVNNILLQEDCRISKLIPLRSEHRFVMILCSIFSPGCTIGVSRGVVRFRQQHWPHYMVKNRPSAWWRLGWCVTLTLDDNLSWLKKGSGTKIRRKKRRPILSEWVNISHSMALIIESVLEIDSLLTPYKVFADSHCLNNNVIFYCSVNKED